MSNTPKHSTVERDYLEDDVLFQELQLEKDVDKLERILGRIRRIIKD